MNKHVNSSFTFSFRVCLCVCVCVPKVPPVESIATYWRYYFYGSHRFFLAPHWIAIDCCICIGMCARVLGELPKFLSWIESVKMRMARSDGEKKSNIFFFLLHFRTRFNDAHRIHCGGSFIDYDMKKNIYIEKRMETRMNKITIEQAQRCTEGFHSSNQYTYRRRCTGILFIAAVLCAGTRGVEWVCLSVLEFHFMPDDMSVPLVSLCVCVYVPFRWDFYIRKYCVKYIRVDVLCR